MMPIKPKPAFKKRVTLIDIDSQIKKKGKGKRPKLMKKLTFKISKQGDAIRTARQITPKEKKHSDNALKSPDRRRASVCDVKLNTERLLRLAKISKKEKKARKLIPRVYMLD